MSELRKASDVAVVVWSANEVDGNGASAEHVTADRLAIVEWLRAESAALSEQADNDRACGDPEDVVTAATLDCFAVGLAHAAGRLEAAIRSAAGEGEL